MRDRGLRRRACPVSLRATPLPAKVCWSRSGRGAHGAGGKSLRLERATGKELAGHARERRLVPPVQYISAVWGIGPSWARREHRLRCARGRPPRRRGRSASRRGWVRRRRSAGCWHLAAVALGRRHAPEVRRQMFALGGAQRRARAARCGGGRPGSDAQRPQDASEERRSRGQAAAVSPERQMFAHSRRRFARRRGSEAADVRSSPRGGASAGRGPRRPWCPPAASAALDERRCRRSGTRETDSENMATAAGGPVRPFGEARAGRLSTPLADRHARPPPPPGPLHPLGRIADESAWPGSIRSSA